jgi:hypothetical protein
MKHGYYVFPYNTASCHFDRGEKSPGCGAIRFLTFVRNEIFAHIMNLFESLQLLY